MKKCTKCLKTKPETEFYAPKGRKRADGTPYRLPSCKQCFAAYYATNRERQQASTQKARIKRRYGLTLEQHDAMKAAGCVVCGSHYRVHIDHCHTTGVVRGALCQECNQALGHAKDDPEILRKLIVYLESDIAISQGLVGPSY